MKTKNYTHDQLDNEVNAIGGWYTLTKEIRLPFVHCKSGYQMK